MSTSTSIADLIITNAKVVTVDNNFSIQQAIAVKNGWIIAVGSQDEINALMGPSTKVRDLKGKTILPGANDTHMHGVYYGSTRPPLCLNLTYPGTKSITDMVEQVRKEAEKIPAGKWIKGFGWDQGFLDECKHDTSRLPRRSDFDAVSPDNPIVLVDFSAHIAVVNSKALELAGITKDTPDPGEGVMERDPRTGEPTGVFIEFPAQAMVMGVVPLLSDDEIEQAIRTVQHELNKNGVTSYTDASLGVGGNTLMGGAMGARAIDIYKKMQDEGKLSARVSIGLLMGDYGALSYDDVKKGLEELVLPDGMDPYSVRIPMLKVFADGVPMVKTAWLWEDYIGGGHGALSVPGATEEERYDHLIRIIGLAHSMGYQVGVHAIGDRASDAALDGFIKAMHDFPRGDPRHYVIHGDFVTKEWARRAAKYRVSVAMQPTIGAQIADIQELFVGVERAAYEWPTRMVLDAGVMLTGGSDTPITYPNWLTGVQDAVLRIAWGSGKVSGPDQRITVEEAIRMYTINGAWQDRMEHIKGSIEAGKLADLQVLSDDILSVAPHDIGKIQVEKTFVGGKIVYEA